MSEPFLRLKPVSMQKVRLTLRQTGISPMGAVQLLEGRPVGLATDRLRLAELLIQAIGDARVKPAEFKPAEFKPAEFKPAEFRPARR